MPTTLNTQLTGFLSQHCHDCHAGNDPEGGLRLDQNAVAFGDAEVRRRWTYLYDRVAEGEMPPAGSEQPDSETKRDFLRTLGGVLTRADLEEREVVLRRLNRNEYTNSVSDLFGIFVDVSRVLMDDSTDHGFDTIGSELSLSSEQMQTYVEAADVVLDHVFGAEKQVPSTVRTANFATAKRTPVGSSERKLSNGVVMFSGAKHLPLYGYSAPVPGLYRVRVQVRAEQSRTPVVMQVIGGNTGQIGIHTVGFFEAPVGQVKTIEFTDRAKEYSDCLSFTMMGGFPRWSVNAAEYQGPGLFIGDITIEGPIDEWTPARRRLLGSVNPQRGTLNDVRSILQKVMPRAFRRPVEQTEIEPYVGLAKLSLADGRSFEKSLRLALKGVLCAPEFLYLEEPVSTASGQSSSKLQADSLNFVLASRLSYFLWSSLPDEELLSLAGQGKLTDAAVLNSQIGRMLDDPKSQRFVENFTGQWLRVRDIDFTVPDRNLYPEYSPLLREAMIGETHAFFREVLDSNLSVQNFIDSDFLMLNQPLADFYGVPGVKGLEIRRVPRPDGSVRGGVLTQASVLKVSADGTRTSPVLRGVWIMNHLFGKPPSPPPANVEIVQPDIRGAETIREQLARHRADLSCARCHNRIDPPGFALESFDVLGAQRDWYRTRGQGGKYITKAVHPFAPKSNVNYQQGPDVDSSGTMPDGRRFADIREYKRLLLADETAMPEALARLLLSYSLGRELGFSDRTEVRRIVDNVREKNFGLKSMIEAVVVSELFRSP